MPAYVVPAYVVPAYVGPAYVVPAYVVPADVAPAYMVPANVVPADVMPTVTDLGLPRASRAGQALQGIRHRDMKAQTTTRSPSISSRTLASRAPYRWGGTILLGSSSRGSATGT